MSLLKSFISFASVCLCSSMVLAQTTTPDACESIRDQIKMAQANDTINLPEGLFDCSHPIIIDRSDIKLIGAGVNRTVIRLAKDHYAPLLIIGDVQALFDESMKDFRTRYKVKNVTVANITFDGNLAEHPEASTRECGEKHCDGDVLSPRNNAVTIRGAEDILLQNIVTRNSISGGVVTEKYCKNLRIVNLESSGNFFDGFAGYQTTQSVFKNFYMHNNNGAGLSLDIEISHNHFENILIRDNKDVGIFARALRGNLFENMIIENNGNHAIFIAAADRENVKDTCASDNEFRHLNILGSPRSAVRINDRCEGNKITGNSKIVSGDQKCIDNPMGATILATPTTCPTVP